MFKVNNKDTFHTFSSVSTVNFEHVIAGLGTLLLTTLYIQFTTHYLV